MAGIEIRRAGDRTRTTTDWLDSAHSFAFGPHYDPANVAFGPLIALNSDLVQPGPGYVAHRHAGVEILSWVTEGVLEHVAGEVSTQVRPGQLQYLSTGAGIEHTERSAGERPVRVLQLWLAGRAEGESLYTVEQIPDGAWVLAASSSRSAPIRLRHVQAELYLGRLEPGATITLAGAQKRHVFVVRGELELDGHELMTEDEARLTKPVSINARTSAEILVWAFA